MSFLNFRNLELSLNNQKILANSIDLSQSIDVANPVFAGQRVSEYSTVESPLVGNLKLSYYLTGTDFLQDYIYGNENHLLTGNIAGISFGQGYLNSYSLSARPNSPILINANIIFFDNLTGNLVETIQTGNLYSNILNFSDAYFRHNNDSELLTSNLNIIEFNWNYSASVKPSYNYYQSGINNLRADSVCVNEKIIDCELVTDSTDIPLNWQGQLGTIELYCSHPENTGIYEVFSCSGFINEKNFNLNANDTSLSSFKITQGFLNQFPQIDSISTNSYPINNYITIYSTNNYPNGFISNDGQINFINKVNIGDTSIPFDVKRQNGYDIISGTLINDIINGFLVLETNNGIVQYPTPLTLNFPPISVSSFTPNTGNYHSKILISGNNFYRIDSVKIGNRFANFNVISPSGIVAYIPDEANIDKIYVYSNLKNRTGISSNVFYPQIDITSFSPMTGKWNDIIYISGNNFSGITNLYFNNIASPSFKVVNNNLITGMSPSVGAGYAKGFITAVGVNGMVGKSICKYTPDFPITGMSVISGTSAEDLSIMVYTADTDYLFNSGNSYKLSFGDVNTYFYKKDSITFTGLIPTGFLKRPSYISFYEPDGITKYKSFATGFQQVGPAPQISKILPSGISFYKSNNISIEGQGMKDFFGWPHFLTLSGYNGEIQNYGISNISSSLLNNKIIINNVRLTGINWVTGQIYYYDVILRNYVGSGIVKSGIYVSGFNLSPLGIPYHLNQEAGRPHGLYDKPAANAVDNSNSTFSLTNHILTDKQRSWNESFISNPIDISRIEIYPVTGIITIDTSLNFDSQNYFSISTGYIEIFAKDGKTWGINSGILFTGNLTGVQNSKGNYFNIQPPITGVTGISISPSGIYDPDGPNNEQGGGLGFYQIKIY